MIVIANYGRNFIFKNLSNLKKLTNEKILVIDNNSKDCKDISDFMSNNNINGKSILNKDNWEWSAWWAGYYDSPNEDKYMFIHDSMFINKPTDFFFSGLNNKTVSIFDTRNPGWHISKYNIKNCDLSIKFLNKFKYNKTDFRLVFGSMFCCNNKILRDMNSRGLMGFSAKNRTEAEAAERLLGVYFKKFGINTVVNNKNKIIYFSMYKDFVAPKNCAYVKFRPTRNR